MAHLCFKARLERVEVEEPVYIPTIAETVQVRVPAWRDPKDGTVYFDMKALTMLDKVKNEYMSDINLLKASIAKWETNRDDPVKARLGPNNCPLCHKYYIRDCVGCPISQYTNLTDCGGSPYDQVVDFARGRYLDGLPRGFWDLNATELKKWRRLCNKEIKFLKLLLKHHENSIQGR